ncbi:uncharacterized protein LOC129337379 [Eublepharis macularius]|uniref:Uncharacterized protein LOC129337379 n=1 Tax=Eublepharis macularius TaxID=481883 RepID=A0AA97K1N0_EUBMA|nr:uncharacterized protein LOC129337379 [Eublepharis macularius]
MAKMETLALQRKIQVGMLYDCSKDALLPDAALWDENTLGKNTQFKPSPSNERTIIESDTIEDKMSALKIPESLKASLLCGLLEPKGSARYLQDSKSSCHQARVALLCSVTTKLRQLDVNRLSCPDDCNIQTASRIVTDVLYGAQAIFVLDQEASPLEDLQEIQKSLQVQVKRILSGASEGIARGKKVNCKIYSDVPLADHPMTYGEAENIFSTVSKHLAEQAVPVRIWLHPLTKLGFKIPCRFREINPEIISEVQNVLQQLTEIDMRQNDLAKYPAATTFPEIKRKLQQFQGLYQQYRQNLQKRLSRTTPLIRRGEEEEDALTDLLSNKQQALFSGLQLSAFLDRREQELVFVNSYLDVLKDVDVVSTRKELDRLLVNPSLRWVVAFVFTSLQDGDSYLSDLENSLAAKKSFCPVAMTSTSEKLWFEHREISKKARGSARAFLALAHRCSKDTKLIVCALPDLDHPGISIYLYEDGELVSTNFEPPSKPLPPSIGEVCQDSMQLTFNAASYGKAEISGYRVEYRPVGQENWVPVEVKGKQQTFTVTGLHSSVGYQFQYAAVSRLGFSESSDPSDIVKTLPEGSPGKAQKAAVTCQVSPLHPQGPSISGSDRNIQECEPADKKEPNDTDDERNGNTFQEVARMSQRDRSGRMEPLGEALSEALLEKPEMSPSPKKADERITDKMIKQSTLLDDGPLPVYQLPLKKSVSSCDGFIKYKLGYEDPKKPHKVIMVMGATGSGKTTLINGMINYILGVHWEDGFRFNLIHEQTNRSQAESQTSDVTAYEINFRKGFTIPYSLTIIDTPGFGDTRGIEHDRQIIEKVREFFCTPGGIDHIDGVCFVVQSSLARLTQAQKYVFDSVLSIFGKDIKANILILVTFADGQAPPVLEAILESEVPCAKDDNNYPVHFKFNNSALFVSNFAAGENTLNFDKMFWKMGTASMQTFFQSLLGLEPRSLILTKEVLQERKRLETAVEGLQPQIKAGLTKLDSLRKTKQILEQHKDEMAANKDFEVEVPKTIAKKFEINEGFITNCQKCHFTCHYPCYIPNDREKHKCTAMNGKGDCEVCPGKCRWDIHFNQKYRWEYETVKEKQTYAQIKEKYERACGEVLTTEKFFEELQEEYAAVEDAVLTLIEQSSHSIQRLQEIALKPNPMATPEHIDLLIQAEQQEAKPGFQDRIKALQGVREMAVIVNKIARNEPLLPAEEIAVRKCKAKSSKYYQKIWSKFTNWIASSVLY